MSASLGQAKMIIERKHVSRKDLSLSNMQSIRNMRADKRKLDLIIRGHW